MKRRLILLFIFIFSVLILPSKIEALEWEKGLICNASNGFKPGATVTCVYSIVAPEDTNGISGIVETSSNITITSIEKYSSSYQGDVEQNRFDFYSLTSDATSLNGKINIIKINIKLGEEEQESEYIKVKDVKVVDKEYQELSIGDISTEINIKNDSTETNNVTTEKEEGQIIVDDKTNNSNDIKEEVTQKQESNPKTSDYNISMLILSMIFVILLIFIGFKKLKKKKCY